MTEPIKLNKMRTSELTGAALDWAVAKCEGMSRLDERVTSEGVSWAGDFFQPSKHWSEGGPIIERERISTEWSSLWNCWTARDLRNAAFSFTGPTPLIAAMRCFVASRLGEEVEVPDELA
ncbi:hypothetical protein [EBPR siphovirus 1]|nr:hypothetical protein [EBPR siphovirus 1]